MELFSLKFILFLLLSVSVFWLCHKIASKQVPICLLSINIAFYYLFAGPASCYIIFFVGLTSYFCSRYLRFCSNTHKALIKQCDKTTRKTLKNRLAQKRLVLIWIAIVVVSLPLLLVKYATGGQLPSVMSLVFPLGISFYSFQAVAYVLDVYYEKIEPEKDLIRYLAFLTYFPQLIQGPINRYEQLAPQLFEGKKISEVHFESAFRSFGYGLFKKAAIANLLGPFVAGLLAQPAQDTPGYIYLFALFLFAIQQYADFSGGIDMVLAVAELMGVQMQPNFRRPYFSTSLADFWRRWHISLGLWMKDYLFYPLALTRPLKALSKFLATHKLKHLSRSLPAALSNIVVFIVVGLWHGPETHYLLWGLYNGLVIAASDLLKPQFTKCCEWLHIKKESLLYLVWSIVRTFFVVLVGSYFDRIEDVALSFKLLAHTIFAFNTHPAAPALAAAFSSKTLKAQLIYALAASLVLFFISLCQEYKVRKGQGEAYVFTEGIFSRHIVLKVFFYSLIMAFICMSFYFNVGGGFLYANY